MNLVRISWKTHRPVAWAERSWDRTMWWSRDEEQALPGVYAIFRRDVLLYIGQSKNVARRLAKHELRRFFRPSDVVAVRYIRPDENLDTVEARLIRRLRPPMNRRLL